MPSPIKQARLQGQTLMSVLSQAVNKNVRPALQTLPVDVLVAFSNHNGGVFIAKDKSLYPEMCPADAADDRVKEVLVIRAKNPQDFSLSETNRDKLANYLIKIHKPYQAAVSATNRTYPKQETEAPIKVEQTIAAYTPVEKPNSAFGTFASFLTNTLTPQNNQFKHICRKCKSDKLEVRFGKNYYLKCLSYDENNRIDSCCSKCKSLLKIRKDKNLFFAECKNCNSSELFHSNS